MKKYPLTTIWGTEERLVKAKFIDQEYSISVALPYHYHDNPNRAYPVIYVLDGNWYFGMVVDMVRIMNTHMSFCDELPDAVIVGIGYPNGEDLDENKMQVSHRRLRDFTATRYEELEVWHQNNFPIKGKIQSGGASKFLTFLSDELLPLIESEYRVDKSDRVLLGHSLGGFFALHTVFSNPALFQKYVIASPAELYMSEDWFDKASSINSPVQVYLSAGEPELHMDEMGRSTEHSSFEQLAQLMEDQTSGGTTLTKQIFPKLTHCAVVAPAFQAGLVAVLHA